MLMTQRAPRSCPKCDAPAEEGQRFCSNCGSLIDTNEQQKTAYSGYNTFSPEIGTPPPPPNYEQSTHVQEMYPPVAVPTPVAAPLTSVPDYERPQPQGSAGRILKRLGIFALVLLVLILALCGGATYYGYRFISSNTKHNTTTSTSRDTSSTSSSSSSTQSQGQSNQSTSPTTTALNLHSVTYASSNITVKNVQQAQNFNDDTQYDQPGILRINLQEENTTSTASSYFYSEMMFLVTADGTTTAPLNERYSLGPDASIKRDNWVDFALPTSAKPDQLTLRLGKSSEAQINIPLKAGANLDQYQPQTTTPNVSTQYGGTNWTLTSVSRQLSYATKQADKGNVYIVTTFTIDNNTQNDFYPFPSDTLRLQNGNTKTAPENTTTFPSSIPAGQTNTIATCAFMMPADSTNFTLILLPSTSTGAGQQATLQFKISH
jgi:hypothetical protein